MSSGNLDLRKRSSGASQSSLSFSSTSKKKPTLRVRRRRTRVIFGIGALVLLGGFAYGIHWISYMPRFSLNAIEVAGAHSVVPQSVQDFVNERLSTSSGSFFSRRNIFLYPRVAIEKAIPTEFPRVESALITRQSLLATAITVTIQERQSYAKWCLPAQAGESATCYAMDSSGFIFAPAIAGATFSSTYVFSGGLGTSTPIGTTYLPNDFSHVRTVLEGLVGAGLHPEGADALSERDYQVALDEGYYLKIAFDEDPVTIVKNLNLVLASHTLSGKSKNLEYIDLRFGNRVYYKFVGAAESSQ